MADAILTLQRVTCLRLEAMQAAEHVSLLAVQRYLLLLTDLPAALLREHLIVRLNGSLPPAHRLHSNQVQYLPTVLTPKI